MNAHTHVNGHLEAALSDLVRERIHQLVAKFDEQAWPDAETIEYRRIFRPMRVLKAYSLSSGSLYSQLVASDGHLYSVFTEGIGWGVTQVRINRLSAARLQMIFVQLKNMDMS